MPDDAMRRAAAKPIAVVQGATSPEVQALMRRFVAGLEPCVRVAGVVEEPVDVVEGTCSAGELRSLADGRRFPLLQDLGPSAMACRLDAGGVVSACEAVQRAIGAGCDLVVLNKFGKIEADRSGLAPAFASALEARAPILTSVSPKFMPAWEAFAGSLYAIVPPDLGAIEDWWAHAAAARAA